MFVFGDFKAHHKDWLTYSGGTNFSISNDLTQMVRWSTFVLRSVTVTLTVLVFLDLFLLALVFVLQWVSVHWEILIIFSQFPLTFHHL